MEGRLGWEQRLGYEGNKQWEHGRQVESDFPPNSKQFIAVAMPRLAVPSAPALNVELDSAVQAVNVSIGLRAAPSVAQLELYRISNDTLTANVDTMARPWPSWTSPDPK